MTKKNFAVWALQVVLAAVMVILSACTDENGLTKSSSTEITPSVEPQPFYEMVLVKCESKISSYRHTYDSGITVFRGDERSVFKKTVFSNCSISCTEDTFSVMDGEEVVQTGSTIKRSYENGVEKDEVRITLNCNQTIVLPYSAEHAPAEKYEWTDVAGATRKVWYQHGHDSLIGWRFLRVEYIPLTKAVDVPSEYIKATVLAEFYVETTTVPVNGKGEVGDQHIDVLKVQAIAQIWDKNEAEVRLGKYGTDVIDETTEKDSVELIFKWKNGYEKSVVYPSIRNRNIENIARQTEFVSSFDYQVVGTTFVADTTTEQMVRSDANWTVFRRNGSFTKPVSVHGTTKNLLYPEYRERSVFRYEKIIVPFGYGDWNIVNTSDDFIPAASSDKEGYDELDYVNTIGANYRGWRHSLNEVVSWYVKGREFVKYELNTKLDTTHAEYVKAYVEKIAVYDDGSKQKVGEFEASFPIIVTPKTNWVINTDHYGSYESNEFSKRETKKTAKTANKVFSYNEHTYICENTVSGQKNAVEVVVPNEIVFSEGGVSHRFEIIALNVRRLADATRKSGSESGVDTYAYTCTAGVTFGASQEVSLPGTIIVDTRNHEHGKVRATYMTTTPNEDRSFYKSVAVIEFEDGFRKVGMCENGENTFSFTMTSTSNVNSAVYADGRWMPSTASDETRCMRWRDESGASRRVLDYITATAQSWNNGHNTVVDVRREGKISADGYSVTFYLNGEPGQTLNF